MTEVYQEDIITANICVSKTKASKKMRFKKRTKQYYQKIGNFIIILSTMDRSCKQRINKKTGFEKY